MEKRGIRRAGAEFHSPLSSLFALAVCQVTHDIPAPYHAEQGMGRLGIDHRKAILLRTAKHGHGLGSGIVRIQDRVCRRGEEIVKKLSKGKLKIEFEHVGLDPLGKNLDRITNRLSFSLVVSAIIVASSLIMQTNTGYMFMGYPVLGIIGYLVAGGLGFWLAIAILRSGRM